MLRDFAVFDAEDIDSSLTAIAGFQRDVIVDKHEIAVSADMFDFRPAFREFFEESLDAGLKRLTAVGEAGAVRMYFGAVRLSITEVLCLLKISFQKYSTICLLFPKDGSLSAASAGQAAEAAIRLSPAIKARAVFFIFIEILLCVVLSCSSRDAPGTDGCPCCRGSEKPVRHIQGIDVFLFITFLHAGQTGIRLPAGHA